MQSTLVKFVEVRRRARRRRGARRAASRRRSRARRRPTALQTLDAADAEDELLDLLEELGVPEAWRLAEPLAAAGVDREWLDRVARARRPGDAAALHWVAATLTIGRVSVELCESTDRISALVSAVKSYAYMDRGGLVEVDLHEGLETTLTVLNHKLKHTAIRGRARLRPHAAEADRARLRAQPGLDEPARQRDRRARRARARSRSARARDGGYAIVEIADDGPGIPDDVRDRDLRPVLHDEGRRRGHRPGPRDGAADRRRAPRRLAERGVRPGETTFRVKLPARADLTHDPHGGAMARCTHLDSVTVTELPESVDGCDDCLATGDPWCHLRICLTAATSAAATTRPTATRRARGGQRTPAHPLDPARRGLVVVLRRRGRDADPRGGRRAAIPPSPMGCP